MLWLIVFGAWTLLLSIYTLYWLKAEKSDFGPKQNEEVPVSVIVAVRNEADHIDHLIGCIRQQSYGFVQLVVVDDNSTDGTYEQLQAYAEAGDVCLLRAQGAGKKQALAQGVSAAEGDILIFTDADCTMGPDWIATHVGLLHQTGAALSVGLVRTQGGSMLERLETVSLQAVTGGSVAWGRGVMCSGANLAIKREWYDACMGDLCEDEASGDDMFLLAALKKKGAKVVLAKSRKAIVSTRAMGGLRSFLRQRARWVGKAKSYTDTDTILVAVLTVAVQTLLLLALALYPVQHTFLWSWAWCFVTDLCYLTIPACHLSQQKDLLVYPLAFVLYPFYVILIIIRSLLPVQWKGRTV
ncbi:MAG: glycosyltransferase [Paludibacteraceae bacterium]|nr:glycosyltransferase [Paludibacteraceae bacterium]